MKSEETAEMGFFLAYSGDDIWACSKDVWIDDGKQPKFRENKHLNPLIRYGAYRLYKGYKCELYFETDLKFIKDIRAVIDGHEKIYITKLSKKKYDLVVTLDADLPDDCFFACIFNPDQDKMAMQKDNPLLRCHGGFGKPLMQWNQD